MRRHRTAALALLFAAAFTGCAKSDSTDAGSQSETPAGESNAASSSTAPTQSPEPVVDPRPVTAADLQTLIAENQGKAVLVDFWATWCVPCVEQYPHTVELSQKHPGDLVVFTVSMDEADEESLAGVKSFLAANGVGNTTPLHSADGGSEQAYIDFDITGGALPHYKVYGRDGQLAASFGGDVDNPLEIEQVDAAVAAALGE